MTAQRRVGIACNRRTRVSYLGQEDLARLSQIADVSIEEFEVRDETWEFTTNTPEDERRLAQFSAELDALIVCHGSPRVTREIIKGAQSLALIGELEGDRFGGRIDVEAARQAGIVVVDTTHSSSWPVSEWALALMLVGLRQHARVHDIIAGKNMSHGEYRTDPPARELTGKSVGLIGFGHIAWRLRELLYPFSTDIVAYDPYAPRELADALRVDFAPLETVLRSDVVVCLAPATPRTAGMIGRAELAQLRPASVFVNVSRGVVVDVPALIERAEQGDVWFGLDAHDPEPIAVDSPLRRMHNVFLSPHIGGVTAESRPRFFTLMVDELERYFTGREPRAQLTDRVLAGRRGE